MHHNLMPAPTHIVWKEGQKVISPRIKFKFKNRLYIFPTASVDNVFILNSCPLNTSGWAEIDKQEESGYKPFVGDNNHAHTFTTGYASSHNQGDTDTAESLISDLDVLFEQRDEILAKIASKRAKLRSKL